MSRHELLGTKGRWRHRSVCHCGWRSNRFVRVNDAVAEWYLHIDTITGPRRVFRKFRRAAK